MHKSGFVNILGRPNAGKSTLLNALLGEQMAITSAKPQTTRHRILGILNGDHYQIVISDTPGVIDQPAYEMQEAMVDAVHQTFEDADLILYMITPEEPIDVHLDFMERLGRVKALKFLVLNKVDLVDERQAEVILAPYMALHLFGKAICVSAKDRIGLNTLMEAILEALPEGPEYYPKDQLSDRPERFFVTEMIRKHILELYHQEIPYSCEVGIEEYTEDTGRQSNLTYIRAIIYVNRKSQKPILIGKNGEAIKQLGILARKDIEAFLGNRVHLELFVKVRENWRDDERALKEFGYRN